MHQYGADWTDVLLKSMQLRAARALLGWTARELAEQSHVHLSTVQRMEQCHGTVRGNVTSLDAILDALQDSGIEFISENGRIGVVLNEGNSAQHMTD